jgi:hypothetical protein
MDEILDAEQAAARAAARRRRSLRDLLLGIEDRGDVVTLHTTAGTAHRGVPAAVGLDHVELAGPRSREVVSLEHIVAVVLS